MYRTHNCGELRLEDQKKTVKLSGWVQTIRDKGFVLWIELRDRFGTTQIVLDEERTSALLLEKARTLGREFVISVEGEVIERESKNPNSKTGAIEILAKDLQILNASETPPFTIEKETDGGEELRMKYRYLDIRRPVIAEKLIFRHKVEMLTRNYLTNNGFVGVETPFLIKSTPEGARDFVVPSRMHAGQFYALPQSPQTFKQLLMVGGLDKYYQIVKCFRDEDLRADRQPEFTQIDCEMSFVSQQDVMDIFEDFLKYLLHEIHGIALEKFPVLSYAESMQKYGSDKPDIRFGMEFCELNDLAKNKGFKVFDEQELVVGIALPSCANYTRKQLDAITEWVKRPQIGCNGLVYVKYNEDKTYKSSVDKFFSQEDLAAWCEKMQAKPGDLLLILSGETNKTRFALSQIRMEMAEQLGLRKKDVFAPLWVVDFPLLEWDEESKRYHAMHHPFTATKEEDTHFLETTPEKANAQAYDLVLNGNEIGGGSVRIHDQEIQKKMFTLLGFSDEEAKNQFGFLMNAFKYGAPPHAGLAFGLDRLVAVLGGTETIRDYIAFPKNNAGRDVMIDAPSFIDDTQLKDLRLRVEE